MIWKMRGLRWRCFSGGQTSAWNITPEYKGLKNVEVQAGNYVFTDWVDRQEEGLEVFQCALTVLTRRISRPKPHEAMFDFGMNSCADESGLDYSKIVGPRFKGVEGLNQIILREELAYANCKGCLFRNKGG
jgi:D-serine deaminase-like pyridoxal phosphate-dependent protein